jgi:hypothetical protein
VAVSGRTAIVGAPRADVGINGDAGAAYVFEEQDGQWRQTAVLYADIPVASAGFGWAVAVRGNLAAVSQEGATDPAAAAVYVYQRQEGGTWVSLGALPLSAGGYFPAVALGDDFLAVGAPRAAPSGLSLAGAVYVFAVTEGQWVQTAELIAPAAVQWEYLGSSLAADGHLLAIGAPGSNFIPLNRAAYVFQFNEVDWQVMGVVQRPAGAERFGARVALQGDVLLVGAPGSPGRVFAYAYENGAWVFAQELEPPPSVVRAFGTDVALAGNVAVVTQDESTLCPMPNCYLVARAHLFSRIQGIWSFQGLLVDATGYEMEYARNVAMAGHSALIGMTRTHPYGSTRVFATNCPVESDWDGDGDVDDVDFANLTRCLQGPGAAIGSDCGPADLNGDQVVDLADFARFSQAFGTVP